MIMFPRPNVWIDTLGICPRCRKILTVQWVIFDFLGGATIICLNSGCEARIFPKDIGYEVVSCGNETSFAKKRWVRGPDGIWTHIKPKKEFDLFDWHIVLNPTEADFDEKYSREYDIEHFPF